VADVTILASGKPDGSDTNLVKLVEHLGVNCRVLTSSDLFKTGDPLSALGSDSCKCLMIDADCLRDLLPGEGALAAVESVLLSEGTFVLIYNVHSDEQLNKVPGLLSGEFIQSIIRHDSGRCRYQVAADSADITRQFSGLSFESSKVGADFGLKISDRADGVRILVSANDVPLFVVLQRRRSNLFVLSSSAILDIDDPVDSRWDPKDSFSQFIPVMMFLKYALGERCWHSPRAYASFIIDDPLLIPSYGFLEFEKLLGTMDSVGFHTALAFIPLNFERSNDRVAAMMNARRDRFSVCLHGCNHTNNEFGPTDGAVLWRIAKQAVARMEAHRSTTGVDYDDVMVFPQGRFSSVAMDILKSSGYLAAVNTSAYSVDDDVQLRVSDLLETAVLRYSAFPLFTRNYPNDVFDFAFDLFVGKPALIVEHHDCFRGGYSDIAGFIRSVIKLDENIEWRGLAHIAQNSYLERDAGDGEKEIKLFSNRCVFNNSSPVRQHYTITKEEWGAVPIRRVLIDGENVSYDRHGRSISMVTTIPPENGVELQIEYEDLYGDGGTTEIVREPSAIWLRRYLSEFRDNYVSKSDIMTSIANKVTRIMRKV